MDVAAYGPVRSLTPTNADDNREPAQKLDRTKNDKAGSAAHRLVLAILRQIPTNFGTGSASSITVNKQVLSAVSKYYDRLDNETGVTGVLPLGFGSLSRPERKVGSQR